MVHRGETVARSLAVLRAFADGVPEAGRLAIELAEGILEEAAAAAAELGQRARRSGGAA